MKYFLLILLFVGTVTGCKKFVQVAPPVTLTVSANIYNNSTLATSALTSIYSQMVISVNNWPYWSSFSTGVYGDELQCYAPDGEGRQLYTDALDQVSSSSTSNVWNNSYNLIYKANSVIEGLEDNGKINARIAKQLTAEAKFIRAYWYFYLTNLFGKVPVITGTDYAANARAARDPQDVVYRQIISDLLDATADLNPGYVDISDTTVIADRFRPNAYAADALLARVYLFTEKYDSAALYATKVISQSSLYDTVPLNNIVLINNKEAIWQLMMGRPSPNNTYEAYNYILTGAPQTQFWHSTTISPQLMNAFEAGDQRKTAWIAKYTDNTVTPAKDYYFPYKYKVGTVTSAPQEYSVVLRLAEQYLIRAEARAQTDDIPGAQADLNIIRHRAGLPNTTASTKEALLPAILQERQVELFCEYGLRWLDLKRTGKVDEVMEVVTPAKGGTWNSDKALWPVPQSEILNDPNLAPNNHGY